MNLKIGYANIYVSDIERAVRFYRDVLGLKLLMRDDGFGYASFDGGTIRIGISVVRPGADNFSELVGGQTGIAFIALAIDPIFSALRDQGVQFPPGTGRSTLGRTPGTVLGSGRERVLPGSGCRRSLDDR